MEIEKQIATSIYAFTSAVGLAFLTAVFAYWRYTREQKHQQDALLNALFGELANIYEHYTYASFELPLDPKDQQELKKRLKWSIYGNLRSTKDVTRFGFLNASDINSLLQLELRIRNNDLLIQQYLDDMPSVSNEQLKYMQHRLKLRMTDSYGLLERLFVKSPRLRNIFSDIKRGLPGGME